MLTAVLLLRAAILLRPQPSAIHAQMLFAGIEYSRESLTDPRPLVLHIARINPRASGIRFEATAGVQEGEHPLRAETTSAELLKRGAALAVNGDFFFPWHYKAPWDYYPHIGDPVSPYGFSASQGAVVSRGPRPPFSTLFISKDGSVGFTRPRSLAAAISGQPLVMENGRPARHLDAAYYKHLHPRTAIAMEGSGKIMLCVIDGRQPRYSEGVSMRELVDLLHARGARSILNLDGGGSSTMVMRTQNGSRTLNSPIQHHIPGTERPVANHLLVFADDEKSAK